MAAKKYSDEDLNYFRVCHITTRILPDGLRTAFRQEWDTRYKTTLGDWQDTAKNGIDFYNKESPKSRKSNSRLLAIIQNGNTREWDCTCLFYAILYSDSVGKGLSLAVKKSVNDLREFRNKAFAHTTDGRLTEVDFNKSIQDVINAFTTLKLNVVEIEDIKNQKSFPTDELDKVLHQLEQEKKRNDEAKPFCVLPPKPSHDNTTRLNEIRRISQEMEKLRNEKKNEVTAIYLSGNPGCGKSEVARQIGEKFFNEVFDETAAVNFVFTLNAANIETLLQSYVDFAFRLGCVENSITAIIGKAKELAQEDKLLQLKSLIAPRVRRYSSWMIIVDNVTDLKAFSAYLPHVGDKTDGQGQILVTTQDSLSIGPDSHSYHESLSRGMEPEDAIKTLLTISSLTGDEEIALKVAKALDFQPLALACAALYMQRIHRTQPLITWEKYLEKLQEGKREITESVYRNKSLTYEKTMTMAVRMAIEKEVNEDNVMLHALHFLSCVAPEPISLEYAIQYIMKKLPDEDEDLLADHISSSSLILSSDDKSNAKICTHQVVYHCLSAYYSKEKKVETDSILTVIESFSDLKAFNYNNLSDIINARPLVVHFLKLLERLKDCIENDPSIIKSSMVTRDPDLTNILSSIGSVCEINGEYEIAKFSLKLSLELIDNKCEENHPILTVTLRCLGLVLCDLAEYEEGKRHLERALSIDESVYGKKHPKLSFTLNNLGYALRELGQDEEALNCFERALAINDNAYDQATTLSNLGGILIHFGRLKEAKSMFERVLAIDEHAHDEKHPTLAATLSNLGRIHFDLGKYGEAKVFLERALAINEGAYGEKHPAVAVTLGSLGQVLRTFGQNEEAKRHFERALTINEAVYNGNHPAMAQTLSNLGDAYQYLRQYQEAKNCFERALNIEKRVHCERHPQVAYALLQKGNVLRDTGSYEDAKRCYEEALDIQESAFNGDPHPDVAITLSNMGTVLYNLGLYKEAKRVLEKSLAMGESLHDENHPTLAITRINLRAVILALGQS